MKINSFRGHQTDSSAEEEAMITSTNFVSDDISVTPPQNEIMFHNEKLVFIIFNVPPKISIYFWK